MTRDYCNYVGKFRRKFERTRYLILLSIHLIETTKVFKQSIINYVDKPYHVHLMRLRWLYTNFFAEYIWLVVSYNVNESLKRLIHNTIYVSKFFMMSVEILSWITPHRELFLYLIRTKEYVRRDKHRKEKIRFHLRYDDCLYSEEPKRYARDIYSVLLNLLLFKKPSRFQFCHDYQVTVKCVTGEQMEATVTHPVKPVSMVPTL